MIEMASYPPAEGYPPPGAPVTNPPGPGASYPPPATNYSQPGVQPPSDGIEMPEPAEVPVCPPGLKYLTMIDQLVINQRMECIEGFFSYETKNKYTIRNSLGQQMYSAIEDTTCCTRNCLGTLRPFDIKIKHNYGNEVIHLYRPCRCASCWCPCCLQEMEVMAPPGTVIGSVVQEWSILFPNFRVQNAAGETVLRIEGPLCTFSLCGGVEFKVLSKDGKTEVGNIRKKWVGLLREALTDADNFGITFPLDLDVHMKAVLLGACMLIDFMYFETQGDHECCDYEFCC